MVIFRMQIQKIYRRILLFFILFNLILSGCVQIPGIPTKTNADNTIVNIGDIVLHHNWSHRIMQKEVLSQLKNARGIGFVRPEHRNIYPFDRPQTEEFRISGNDFEPILIVINGTNKEKTFLITTILDYQQVECQLDGVNGILHEVTVPPEIEMELPYYVKISGTGSHDIQVIAFDYPYNLTLDIDFRMDLYGYVAAKRAQVIVGDDDNPFRLLHPEITGIPIPEDVTFIPSVGFAKDLLEENIYIHPSRRQLYVDSVNKGEPYRFQVLVNNTTEPVATFAMLPFLNYHQITLSGKNVLLAKLEIGQQAVIDVDILIPEIAMIHQLQIIYLFDPYQSILRNEVTAPYVFGSPRIAFDSR